MFDDVLKLARRKPLVTRTESTRLVAYDWTQIERMLPHRPPMLLVDRVHEVDLPNETMIGSRRIDPADPVLAGHFPDYPVYPGALLLEAMGQAALCLQHMLTKGRVEVPPEDVPVPVRLLRVMQVVYQNEARPGRDITLLSKRLVHDSYTVTCAVQAMDEDKILAYGLLEVYLASDDE